MLKRLRNSLFLRASAKSAIDTGNKDEDGLVLVFMPPLLTILAAVEQQKGGPLTEAECVEIRDNSVCMSVRRSVAEEMADNRGYADIDINNPWEDWQRLRQTL